MTPERIADIVRQQFAASGLETAMEGAHPALLVPAQHWHEVALFLRDEPRLRFNMLRCLSGVDRVADNLIEVVYDLVSMRSGGPDGLWLAENVLAVRVRVPRDAGHVASVADVWAAADWHEREAYDMFGVTFDNHPDPRRILCPDDWVGYPLRKDYEFPLEYHGIPATTEFGQRSPRH